MSILCNVFYYSVHGSGVIFVDRFYALFSTITVTGGSLVLCFVLFGGRDFLDRF